MKIENKEYLESVRNDYDKLVSMGSWESIMRTGQLRKFDSDKIRNIVREEINPSYGCNLDDAGAVLDMLHFIYRRYIEQYES
jgi:hypothetical protein